MDEGAAPPEGDKALSRGRSKERVTRERVQRKRSLSRDKKSAVTGRVGKNGGSAEVAAHSVHFDGEKRPPRKAASVRARNESGKDITEGGAVLAAVSAANAAREQWARSVAAHLCTVMLTLLLIAVCASFLIAQDEEVHNDVVRLKDVVKEAIVGRSDGPRPGLLLKEQGVKAKHPVVFVPGIVTSKLELWQALPCAQNRFREHLWGGTSMVAHALLNKDCWLQHLSLNETTGLDPDNIKLRADTGLSSADYLIGDYWVWGVLIENLADVGYDSNSLYMASYDWRLSFHNLERRDMYFSQLKARIELMRERVGHRAVVVTHSMGGLVFFYFLQWVHTADGGRGGSDWAERYIESYVNIGGPLLGVFKTLSALISGEMRDTADLNSVLAYMRHNFVSNIDLRRFFRTLGSLPSMMPKGGDIVWGCAVGNETYDATAVIDFALPQRSQETALGGARWIDPALLDEFDFLMDSLMLESCNVTAPHRFPEVLEYNDSSLTLEEGIELLRRISPSYMRRVESEWAWGVAPSDEHAASCIITEEQWDAEVRTLGREKAMARSLERQRNFANPLYCRLPDAPSMKVFSLYGVGKPTERGYYYRRRPKCPDSEIPVCISTNITREGVNNGVKLCDGDGTVPLISLGLPSAKLWKMELTAFSQKRFNPAGVRSIIREYEHQAQPLLAVRGDPSNADHVDIMGNHALLNDIITIAAGRGEDLQEQIYSDILSHAEAIQLP